MTHVSLRQVCPTNIRPPIFSAAPPHWSITLSNGNRGCVGGTCSDAPKSGLALQIIRSVSGTVVTTCRLAPGAAQRSEPTEPSSPRPSAAGLRWMPGNKDAATSVYSPAICWRASRRGSCNRGTAPHSARTLFAAGDEGAREGRILCRSPVARAFSFDREGLAGVSGFYRSSA